MPEKRIKLKKINNESLAGTGNISVLTSHQDISGKLDKAQTSYKGKNVVVDSSTGNITFEDKPTVPSASTTTPTADTTSGSYGSGTTYARSNHAHPKSSLYAESSHTHGKSDITDFPTIPSKTSDLTNDSGFLTSHQDISGKIDTAGTGLSKSGTTLNHSNSVTAVTTASFKKYKYDAQGHITGTSNVTASDLPSHTHSEYTNPTIVTNTDGWSSTTSDSKVPSEKLVKNSLDGKADSSHSHTLSQITDINDALDAKADATHTHSQYLTEHQSLSGYLQTSDVKDNLTSTDTNKPLSANMGKTLKGLVDEKVSNENRITTTFSPQDYETTTTGSWETPYSVTIPTNSSITFDFSEMFETQGDGLDFTVTGNNGYYIKINGSTYGSFSANSTISISSTVDNTIRIVIENSGGTTLYDAYDTSFILMLFIATNAPNTTFSFGGKKWNHIVPFIDRVYPIGSIYMSMNSVDPSLFIGGVWERIQDKFLLASGSTYAGSTGGSADAVVVSHYHGTITSGEYFVTSEKGTANNTRVTYSSSGNRLVDGQTDTSTSSFHHRGYTDTRGVSGTGKNMPPYLAVYVWKRVG